MRHHKPEVYTVVSVFSVCVLCVCPQCVLNIISLRLSSPLLRLSLRLSPCTIAKASSNPVTAALLNSAVSVSNMKQNPQTSSNGLRGHFISRSSSGAFHMAMVLIISSHSARFRHTFSGLTCTMVRVQWREYNGGSTTVRVQRGERRRDEGR